MSTGQYSVGDMPRVMGTFKVGSTLTDPTTITCKILKPDGTTQTNAYGGGVCLKASTGVFYVDFTITLSGEHWYRFEGTGACIAAGEDYFVAKESRFS